MLKIRVRLYLILLMAYGAAQDVRRTLQPLQPGAAPGALEAGAAGFQRSALGTLAGPAGGAERRSGVHQPAIAAAERCSPAEQPAASSQQPPERLSLERAAFLDSVLADFAEEQERRGVEMHLDGAQAPARVELASPLTARALQNLLGNALRYCQRKVWVAIRRAGEALLIAVEDDGEGISAAERERVFEPFYHLDRNRDRATGGFGLGLAISRRAVENRGGRLNLSAGAQGGALFELRLSSRLGLA